MKLPSEKQRRFLRVTVCVLALFALMGIESYWYVVGRGEPLSEYLYKVKLAGAGAVLFALVLLLFVAFRKFALRRGWETEESLRRKAAFDSLVVQKLGKRRRRLLAAIPLLIGMALGFVVVAHFMGPVAGHPGAYRVDRERTHAAYPLLGLSVTLLWAFVVIFFMRWTETRQSRWIHIVVSLLAPVLFWGDHFLASTDEPVLTLVAWALAVYYLGIHGTLVLHTANVRAARREVEREMR